ncbi:hypothetical protein V1477_021328 [Vespula maculifrons]|uniref:Uncharacterized protein n=1 Tax=Vespula maculifrons TaxID=7453 RepID=A0ABD2AGU3_VESMC
MLMSTIIIIKNKKGNIERNCYTLKSNDSKNHSYEINSNNIIILSIAININKNALILNTCIINNLVEVLRNAVKCFYSSTLYMSHKN